MATKRYIAEAILAFCSGWQMLAMVIQAIILRSRPRMVTRHAIKNGSKKSNDYSSMNLSFVETTRNRIGFVQKSEAITFFVLPPDPDEVVYQTAQSKTKRLNNV